jgi:hypothetical protein
MYCYVTCQYLTNKLQDSFINMTLGYEFKFSNTFKHAHDKNSYAETPRNYTAIFAL